MWSRLGYTGYGYSPYGYAGQGFAQAPQRPARKPCPHTAAFCEVVKKMGQARAKLETARTKLQNEQWWYNRWRCESHPGDPPLPQKVRDICDKKLTEITQLQELVKSRDYDVGALRSKYVDLLKQHRDECGWMPNQSRDCTQ